MPDIDQQPIESGSASGAQLLHKDKNAKSLTVDRDTAKKGMLPALNPDDPISP